MAAVLADADVGERADTTESGHDGFCTGLSAGIEALWRKPISKTKALARSAVQPDAASHFPRRDQGAEAGAAGAWEALARACNACRA